MKNKIYIYIYIDIYKKGNISMETTIYFNKNKKQINCKNVKTMETIKNQKKENKNYEPPK